MSVQHCSYVRSKWLIGRFAYIYKEKTETAIARELGADEVGADLTAEDKIKTVAELEKRYRAAAMVGDGINDASALARVTVGIAMGVAGTDATIEAADVELMAADLLKVAYCLSLGRKARRISRQNIAFSMLIPAVDIVLAYNPQAAEINTSRLT